MISRKRKAERAILTAFNTWAGTNITGVQTLRGRDITDLTIASIRCHVFGQEPLEDISEIVTRVSVEGMLFTSVSVDDLTLTENEAIEAVAETFVEMQTADLLTLLNAQGTPLNIQFTDWQPDRSEDGIDLERRRYESKYTFSAYVRDLTP